MYIIIYNRIHARIIIMRHHTHYHTQVIYAWYTLVGKAMGDNYHFTYMQTCNKCDNATNCTDQMINTLHYINYPPINNNSITYIT